MGRCQDRELTVNVDRSLYHRNCSSGRALQSISPWKRSLKTAAGGQSLVEFILVVPLLLFVLLALIQFGVGIYAQSVVTGAAQEGARVAADADRGINAGVEAATRVIQTGLGRQAVVKVEGGEDGELVAITVKVEVPAFMPLLNKALKFNFHSSASMLKEGWRN